MMQTLHGRINPYRDLPIREIRSKIRLAEQHRMMVPSGPARDAIAITLSLLSDALDFQSGYE